MSLRLLHLPLLVALAAYGLAQAHDADSQTGPLGKVSFPTSCDPKVQSAFERAVAMLHSFWDSAGEKAFGDVLEDDPSRNRDLGNRSILMANPLAGQGASPKDAVQAQEAIDEGAASVRRPSASVTTSKPWRPTTRISRAAPRGSANRTCQGL